MTSFEQYLLDHHEELYQTRIDGFLWDDCCDYDETGRPTWFLFGKGGYAICGDYSVDQYEVLHDGGYKPIRTFKTLKGAMRFTDRLIERYKRLEEDNDE